ncbi:MAG TPA: hypothetical protein VHQ24_07610 [Lachnospiraceae bacterium]|jgi:hypothetical protein|nr:hypothetical protein [Lachnospiraceae bacterium]
MDNVGQIEKVLNEVKLRMRIDFFNRDLQSLEGGVRIVEDFIQERSLYDNLSAMETLAYGHKLLSEL